MSQNSAFFVFRRSHVCFALTLGWAALAAPACADTGRDTERVGAARTSLTFDDVFDSSLLHHVDVTVPSQYLDALQNDRENRVPCDITYDGITVAKSGIKKKGGYGSSRDLYDKTGFSIAFDAFVGSQRLGGLKKLNLNNAVQDPSFVAEHTGYEIYRRAGLHAPLTAHAVVTFNGTPFGLYVVRENEDKAYLARGFGSANNQGNLYEGGLDPDFPNRAPDFVNDPLAIDLNDEAKDKRSRADMVELVDRIVGTPAFDWEARVGEKLDLSNFVTGYAIDALTDNWDGYAFNANNYLMYDNPATGKFVFLPHGMDQLFQADPDRFRWPTGILAQRLRQVPALDARFAQAMNDVLATAWDVPALEARIDKVWSIVHAAPAPDPITAADIARLDENFAVMKGAIAQRKPAPTSGGLRGEYFAGGLDGAPVLVRTDAGVFFDWQYGSPDPALGGDDFAVRWTGKITPEFSELYTFSTRSDDGVRLWIDGALIIDDWGPHGVTEDRGSVALEAGRAYDIKLEYFEAGGAATIQLFWASASRVKQVIPASRLAPTTSSDALATTEVVSRLGDNLCLDVQGASREPGTPLIIWECHGRDNQQFAFAPDGTVRVYGSQCIGVAPDGVTMVIAPCDGSAEQQWQLVPESGEIRGTGDRCIDITGASTTLGTAIIAYGCHGRENQLWDRR